MTALINALAQYFGGKRQLAPKLLEIIEAHKHENYVEPFSGFAGVMIRRENPAPVECVNDISRDIVNLFRCVKFHPEDLLRQLQWSVSSRDEFDNYLLMNPDAMTDIQRAARYLYLQAQSFNGYPAQETGMGMESLKSRSVGTKATWAVPRRKNGGCIWTLETMTQRVRAFHERLQGVSVENRPWRRCIELYDYPETLYYLDPPYPGFEDAYGVDVFGPDDYAEIALVLSAIRGAFVLTVSDTPEMRECFKDFSIQSTDVYYSNIGKDLSRRWKKEIIVTSNNINRDALRQQDMI